MVAIGGFVKHVYHAGGGDIKSRYEVKNPAKRSQWKMLQDENINDEYLK